MTAAVLDPPPTLTAPSFSVPYMDLERRFLGPEELYWDYAMKNRPVIVTGALERWDALDSWTPEFFAKKYGGKKIQFARGPVKELQMDDFIRQVLASRPGNPSPYWTNNPIEDLFPELLEDLKPFPDHTKPNWGSRKFLHKGMKASLNRGAKIELYIGGAGGSFPILHWDGLSSHAFLMQIYGRKKYWAWAPDQTPFMYPSDEQWNLSPIGDVENPDLAKYPEFAKARGYHFHLDPGEILFVPSRWWHTAKMEEPSITISVNTVNKTNWANFTEDITRSSHGLPKLLKKAYLMGSSIKNQMADFF